MVEIKIDNDYLDLFPKEVISFSFAINDLAGIESREGNYSNRFNIPATRNNSSILGYADKINFVTGFKPTKSRNASILIDGLEVQRGFIQVEQYNDTSKEFSISFFSGNTDWIDDISDKSLRDLDTSNYDHVYSLSNITGSFSNTEGYIYPFINYGRFTGNITNDTSITDWKPSIFESTIVKQIFKDANWKVGGNLFNDPFFLRCAINYNARVSLSQETVEGLSFTSSSSGGNAVIANTPIVFGSVGQGNGFGNYDNTTGVYTASETFRATIAARITTTNPFDKAQIRVNGAVVFERSVAFSRAISTILTLSSGDLVTITIDTNTTLVSIPQTFSIVADDDIAEGSIFRMNSVLPDISQEDYIKDVFNRFGVLFTVDSISRTVYLNKFETVKDNIKNALDWTDKVDLSKDIEYDFTELTSGYGKRNLYKYLPNDEAEETLGEDYGYKTNIGNGYFEIDNDFLSKEEEIFESVFCASTVGRCFNGEAIAMLIPLYDSVLDTEEIREVDPRISVIVNSVDVSDINDAGVTSLDIVGSSSTSNVTSVPFAYFHISDTGIDKIDSIGQGLSFGDPFFPKDQNNLLDTYYQDYIRILNNPRRITAYFLLNERDINNLDFLKPIYLGGELSSYFYINKIEDYRPNERGVSKVELVLI